MSGDIEPTNQAKLALTRLKAWMASRVEPVARTAHAQEWMRCLAEEHARNGLMRYSLDEQAQKFTACPTPSIRLHPHPTSSICSDDPFWIHIT